MGNPPWVTNADLGYLKSHNIPEKANFHGRGGLDAITGKSNFDISEWMLVKLMSWLEGRRATIAMLCKTAVARKVLLFGWQRLFKMGAAAMHRIDSAKHFGAGVDACLFVCEIGEASGQQVCAVFPSLGVTNPSGSFGYRDGALVADTAFYDRWKSLVGESHYKWRSGVKHDCAAVMELARSGDGRLVDGEGRSVDIEGRFLYPMLKSSDVAREGQAVPRRWMIVPQTFVGEDTAAIAKSAPKTWAYLSRHRARFERRASSIYKGKPAFSVFGVGDYTFAPWKVAISGLYKKLDFKVIGPFAGSPSCWTTRATSCPVSRRTRRGCWVECWGRRRRRSSSRRSCSGTRSGRSPPICCGVSISRASPPSWGSRRSSASVVDRARVGRPARCDSRSLVTRWSSVRPSVMLGA
ncbi:hypothetical protein [Nannocystis pusilla]|uniref:hypothetical protein n=1 Tax=Nannocystis pusilla TaxID=889268 RepID=UPI003B7BD3C9